MLERILASIQYLLPQHFLSRNVYILMRCETKWIKNLLIRSISRLAGINRDEALSPDMDDYANFNAWFTRALKPGARVFDTNPNSILSPCDGMVSETGELQKNSILQAKGKNYSLQDLLANDPVCTLIEDGFFFHNLPLSTRLPPYPYAGIRSSAAYDSRPGKVVFSCTLHCTAGPSTICT